jgi:hypothetical protein
VTKNAGLEPTDGAPDAVALILADVSDSTNGRTIHIKTTCTFQRGTKEPPPSTLATPLEHSARNLRQTLLNSWEVQVIRVSDHLLQVQDCAIHN